MVKRLIKKILMYKPLAATAGVREFLSRYYTDTSLPVCPPHQGDVIFESIGEINAWRCLEIGFHTGSTAIYMLDGMRARNGTVVSIEPNPQDSTGLEAIREFGLSSQHQVINQTSQNCLPELARDQAGTFDFIFLDGWKTFDAMAVDIYFAVRLLRTGGIMMFDDYQSPSVRKAVRMLSTHYPFEPSLSSPVGAGPKHRIYLAAISGSLRPPFICVRKTADIETAEAVIDWNFFRNF